MCDADAARSAEIGATSSRVLGLKHGRFGDGLGAVGEANFSKLSHESPTKVGQKYAKVKK
jgi:hypothetical protein